MRLRLTYSGHLKAAGNNSNRGSDKWNIRNAIHPQLQEFWDIDPILQGKTISIGENRYSPEGFVMKDPDDFDHAAYMRGRFRIPVIVEGHSFLPLVRKSLSLACSLDILFLRKDRPGTLVSSGGDLDARIKTLFDGLRMPKTAEEMQSGSPVGNPHLCLLEDDSLITDLTVRTDRLLSRPDADKSEVLLIMDVSVKAIELTDDNAGIYFGSRL